MSDWQKNQEDAAVLEKFNYKQELKRSIKLFGSFATAFSAISITTGIFTNYNFVLSTAGPAGIWSWPITVIGQVLVALVFAELASRAPLAGYSYQWVTRLANPAIGWLTGWITFAFLVLVVPTVDSGLAPVLAGLLGLGQDPTILKTIVLVILTIQALINIFGVRLASSINNAAVFTETVGVIGLTVALLIVAFFGGHADWNIIFQGTESASGSFVGPFIMSMLMGLFTLVGFEAPANLSEETLDARRTVPKAVLSSILISGIMGCFLLLAATWGIPDLEATIASENPLPYIISTRLGNVVGTFFLILVVISIFACGLVLTTSASRLIYAMSRDNVFPGAGLFRKVTNKGVPANAVILVWALAVAGTIFSESLTLLVGSTAVLPAMIYLLTVLSYRFGHGDIMKIEPIFSLGRWSNFVSAAAILWLVFSICILTLPADFHSVGYLALAILAAGAAIYYLMIRQRIAEKQGTTRTRPSEGDD